MKKRLIENKKGCTQYRKNNINELCGNCIHGNLICFFNGFFTVLFLHFVTLTREKTLTAKNVNCEIFCLWNRFRFYYCVFTSIYSELISFKKIVYIKYMYMDYFCCFTHLLLLFLLMLLSLHCC